MYDLMDPYIKLDTDQYQNNTVVWAVRHGSWPYCLPLVRYSHQRVLCLFSHNLIVLVTTACPFLLWVNCCSCSHVHAPSMHDHLSLSKLESTTQCTLLPMYI